jgi:PAS domain S-box-containing protein
MPRPFTHPPTHAAHELGELKLTQRALRQLLESAPVAIVAVNHIGDIVYANERFVDLFGYEHQELMGMPIEQLMPERFHSSHADHRDRFIRKPYSRPMGTGMDLFARRKDGREFPMEAGLSFVRVDGHELILSSVVDVSRRKQVEEILERRVEERTREIERRRRVADGLRDVLAILNSNRPLQEILAYIASQSSLLLEADAAAIYRLQAEDEPLAVLASCGLPEEFLTPDAIAEHGGQLADFVIEGQPAGPGITDPAPAVAQSRDTLTAIATPAEPVEPVGRDGPDDPEENEGGSPFRAQLAVPLAVHDDIFGGLMLYYRDTRRFTPEEIELAVTFGEQAKLAIENARLRAQSEQTAVAAERNRIARDLHDSVTQTLFSASLIAEVLPRIWERDLEESKRRVNELRSLTRGALAEMRTLLLELRPASLIEVEINELLRQLTEAAIGRARIPITLTVEGNAAIPPDVKIAFYHIAQEALNNVTKHARAATADVQLIRNVDFFSLTIRDDGRGFEPMHVTAEHLGLSIMLERAADVNAQVVIRSTPGAGTVITVSWNPNAQA